MKPRVNVLPEADADLDTYRDWLADNADPETAERFIRACAETFAKLAELPADGPADPRLRRRYPGVRKWKVEGFEKWTVYYRRVPGGVEIIRVWHGARDIPGSLR